ncbi:MAG TPA: hypothetical protein VLB44_09075 [Kofleriaceae bacterium]|nr:hypothetical protein [Kofleriaceae bacterium]
MAAVRRLLLVFALGACGGHAHGTTDTGIDAGYVADACVGLSCFQFDCAAKGAPPTSVSGTVYAPNGTLPLYGVDVYVPRDDPGPLKDGAVCARCDQGLQGGSLAQTRTDEAGHFKLENVPATTDVPLVIQIGKWRRQIKLQNVAACEDIPLPTADTRLPKNSTEGDIPRIAISTGVADALECLPLKLGIDPKEISASSGTGRIHLYTNMGNTSNAGEGAALFVANWPGGSSPMSDSRGLWGSVANLSKYDIVFLSCEGAQYVESKPLAALQAMQQYADLGGRVFASHWHNIWIGGQVANASYGIPDWEAVANFNFGGNPTPDNLTATIDEVSNPKGMSFAQWMLNVGGSTTKDLIPVTAARTTCTSVDTTKGERWVFLDASTSPGYSSAMNFQFTTPQSAIPEERCGKVVFSDMHVSADSTSSPATAYPSGCSTQPLTPQEKALSFMFFDIASCVGSIF